MKAQPVTIASPEALKSLIKDFKKADINSLESLYSIQTTNRIPKKGGLYGFWWTGDINFFLKNIKDHQHLLKGRQTEEELVNIKFSKEWINLATLKGKVCLYIGKTMNLQKRITSHVKPRTEDIWGSTDFDSGRKPNTASQMRIGIERICKTKQGLEIVLQNVSISYVEMDGVNNCVNKFYLEDLLVGTYFPLLNIDIER